MAFDPFATASAISDCVCARLKSTDRGAAAWDGDCCIIAGGTAAWDNCCETRGTMWVSMQSGVPTQTFPNAAVAPLTCGPMSANQAVVFEIGVVRCVCTMEEDGSECGCEQREQDAFNVMDDLKMILQGLSCCFDDEQSGAGCYDWVMNSWRSLGRLGGCAGIAVTITVEMDGVCCPEEVTP